MLLIESKMDFLVEAGKFYAMALDIADYIAEVEIVLISDKNIAGYCVDCENGCYEIAVEADGFNTLTTLAHEFVHLEQYLSGRMRDCSQTSIIFLDREYIYDINDPAHRDLPFEREAYAMEEMLMLEFVKWTAMQGKLT